MTELNPPTANDSSPPQTGDSVYAYMPQDGEQALKQGVVHGTYGPDAMVNLGNGHYQRVGRFSQLFTPDEVADAAASSMLSYDDGNEVHVSKAIRDVMEHPLASQELKAELDARSLSKYLTSPRTPEDLGLIDVEDLVGSVERHGSNRWKIEEMLAGIADGRYTRGRNQLEIAHAAEDIEILPDDQAAAIRSQINEVNRQALDTLYGEYGADFEAAAVYERRQFVRTQGKFYVERLTTIPTAHQGFSFVESSFTPEDEATATPIRPLNQVEIVIGKPEYTMEDGYLPAI